MSKKKKNKSSHRGVGCGVIDTVLRAVFIVGEDKKPLEKVAVRHRHGEARQGLDF